jgi:hypothetical protein
MSAPRFPPPGTVLLALVLAGCAATTLEGTWTRPGFANRTIDGPVLVVGVARDATVRRIYEDDMATKLRARGVDAVRSYETVPEVLDGDATDRLLAAARRAGARYLLSTALIGQEVEQVVRREPVGFLGAGYRGWYGSYWGLSYPAYTEVRTYTVYVAQTSLTDVAEDRIEWTARTRTAAPSDIASETRAFVDVIVGALAEAELIEAEG